MSIQTSLAFRLLNTGSDFFQSSVPQSSGESPCGKGGWTICVSNPTNDAQANEQGNVGHHRIGRIFAVKKGSLIEGSSGKTSIFSGGVGTDPGVASVGVNLKRARCLIEDQDVSLPLFTAASRRGDQGAGNRTWEYSNFSVLERIKSAQPHEGS